MKIAVIIPSRRRPERLVAVLRALQTLASDTNEIIYGVSYCSDDLPTRDACRTLPADSNVRTYCRTDDCTPGQAFNETVARIEAGIYTGFADDVFPLTYQWDRYIVLAAEQLPLFCWQEAGDPQNTSYGAATARVLKAVGKLSPEYFPFWFNDMWLAEVHHMAFGQRPPLIDGLKLGGNRGPTTGLRDLAFWCRFFSYTRPERIDLAVKLAAEYGHTPKDMRTALEICKAWDLDFGGKCEHFTKRFAPPAGPAEPYYVKAKERADSMMRWSEAAE